MTATSSELDDVFVALADGTRRSILAVLSERGEATATVIATRLPVTRQAVLKHLAVLESAGLVSRTKSGREVRFVLQPGTLAGTSRLLAAMATQWERRLAAIKRIAESPKLE